MRLYLVRHAKSDPGSPDELRPLNAKGRKQARELAEGLAGAQPSLVLTSPLVRAYETAAAIATATGAELRVDERLRPGATAAGLLEAVASEDGPVVAVGHQPDCSEIAVELTGADPGFKPAGMLELELPTR